MRSSGRGHAGEFRGARIVAAGFEDSAAVTEDGALWTWGTSDAGQLGHDDFGLVPQAGGGEPAKEEGVVRLIGGGQMLESVKSLHGKGEGQQD